MAPLPQAIKDALVRCAGHALRRIRIGGDLTINGTKRPKAGAVPMTHDVVCGLTEMGGIRCVELHWTTGQVSSHFS